MYQKELHYSADAIGRLRNRRLDAKESWVPQAHPYAYCCALLPKSTLLCYLVGQAPNWTRRWLQENHRTGGEALSTWEGHLFPENFQTELSEFLSRLLKYGQVTSQLKGIHLKLTPINRKEIALKVRHQKTKQVPGRPPVPWEPSFSTV